MPVTTFIHDSSCRPSYCVASHSQLVCVLLACDLHLYLEFTAQVFSDAGEMFGRSCEDEVVSMYQPTKAPMPAIQVTREPVPVVNPSSRNAFSKCCAHCSLPHSLAPSGTPTSGGNNRSPDVLLSVLRLDRLAHPSRHPKVLTCRGRPCASSQQCTTRHIPIIVVLASMACCNVVPRVMLDTSLDIAFGGLLLFVPWFLRLLPCHRNVLPATERLVSQLRSYL